MTKPYRQLLLEYGFWLAALPSLWTLVAWNRIQGWRRYGFEIDYFLYYTEEITSCVGALVMVWFTAWWLQRFPFRRGLWKSLIFAYLLGSLLFTLGHYGIYILLRVLVFATQDMTYHWQAGLIFNIYYDYQKDLGPYIGIVALMWIYKQFIRHQMFPPETEVNTNTEGRLIVQTGRGEAIIRFEEIDYLESARNYATIYARGREYLVRETLTHLLDRLDPILFERCHRSFVVNLEKIAEVRPQTSGGHMIELTSGAQVPLGRSYRESFQVRLGLA